MSDQSPLAQHNPDQLAELQRRLAELTTVQRVARAINSTLDLDAIFQTVVVQINMAFNYQMVSIYLREGDGLRLQAYLGYDEVIDLIRLDQGVSGRVARTGQPVFVSDEAQDPDFLIAKPGTRQAIIVPLKDGDGQVLGTLAVESLSQPVLTQNDLTILTLLADQISVAIVNVRLFAERKRAELALRRQNEELAALHETTLSIMNRLGQTSLLEAIMTRAAALLGTTHGYLYLLDPIAEELVAQIGIGGFANALGVRARRGVGLAGHVWEAGRSVLIEDYANWPDHLSNFEWLHSAIATPLRAGSEIVGVIGLAHLEKDRAFAASDVALLERFADLASIALDNARLYTAAQQELAERKRAEAEQLALERKLLEARQAESLGVLAGGVAHDFNNLLQVIMGNANLAIYEAAELTSVRKSLDQISAAAQRAAELTRQLLAYAGKGRYMVERVDLDPVLANTVRHLRSALPAAVQLHYSPTPNLPPVQADLAQIRQAVMNLVLNAAEACESTSGRIAIATGWEYVNPAQAGAADVPPELAPGDYVFVEVADSGPGMDQATQARMFEPFFTTKFTGRGLGLAAVQGIIRSHQGVLQVWSAPQQGTRVRFWLPCSSDTPTHDDLAADQPAGSLGTGNRAPASDVILVIDDEDGVRNVAARLLKRAGWTVLTAADGRAGIDVFQANAHAIGCVLLDLTMPHMSGEQVFHELRRIRPDVRIILCSGYSEENATSRFAGHELAGFLHKPFTPDELRDKIQRVLGVDKR
jgi:signal transduction histidine kinase/CheY-like chemotaxis protein